MIPLRQLHLDPDGEAQDPYNRVNWVDYDKVRDLIPRIGSVLKSSPIVVDSQGWIIDGNHRAAAAVEAGLDKIPAYVPVEQLQEFARTGDDGREFMSWQEFLAIVTPAMRGWGFGVENKQPQIMYSRPGRGQGEYYIIILDPQEDMVQYSFMTMDGDQPEMHENNFVGMDRNGAHSLLAKIDEGYSLSDIKQNIAEGRGVKQQIEEFLDSLSPDDVGVEEFPGYRVHYEGFTDDCKSSSDYQRNPNRVYQQVYQDFVQREGGKKPAKSGMVGDEEYPILYSVFKVPQSKTIDTAEKAYSIAYRKKQPWPRGSREEQLIRSDWQLSGLYDQYVLKQDMAENIQLPGDFKLMGQDLFLKNLARNLKQRYPDATVKRSSDRVTAYHNKGDDEALSVMGTEVMDSGYIGVGLDDAFTESFQGVLVPTIKQTTEQLLAANPGTKPALFLSTDNWNPDAWTHIASKLGYRLVADDEQLDENFADGKGPGRPGDSQRHGIPKKATMAELEKAAHAKGRKGQLARWQLNMRRGKAKHNK